MAWWWWWWIPFHLRWIFAPVGCALWQIRWASPGSRDRRKPALYRWTWLEILPEEQKKTSRKRLASLEVWNNGSNWRCCCFGDLLFSRWYIIIKYHPFAGCHFWLHRIFFCWSQVRNAFIGFCSAAVSDTCAVAQWIAGQLAEKTPDTLMGWNTHFKLRVFVIGPMTPNKNAKGKIVASELICLFFFKDDVFFCNVSNPPHTHTHICKGYCLAQALGELVEIDLQPYFNQFPDRNESHLFQNDVWYWNLLRSIREQPLKNHRNKSIKSYSNQFHPCFIIQIKSHQII